MFPCHRSIEAYFAQLSPERQEIFRSKNQSLSRFAGQQLKKIQQIIDAMPKPSESIHFNDESLQQMIKAAKKDKEATVMSMVDIKRQFDTRVNGFEDAFQAFLPSFTQMATACELEKIMWLKLTHSVPAFRSPISMLVTDPVDPAYDQMGTVCHLTAALILKLSINQAVGSPILIFDSVEYIVEPQLIR